jgi:hypothetical protein
MEKTEFAAILFLFQISRNGKLCASMMKWKKFFLHFLSSYLKSCKCISATKIHFLEEFAKKLEKDLEALEVQIQSQDFHYQSFSFEDFFQLPLVVKKEEFSDFDHELENSQWKQNVQIENIHQQFNFENPIEEYIEDHQTNHVHVYDPIAAYMEGFFSSNFSHVSLGEPKVS